MKKEGILAEWKLVIGDKRFSSWSLRAWILLREAGIPFKEINVALRMPDTAAQILVHSPGGKLPALITPEGPVWESLSVAEFVAEAYPEKKLWPADIAARALARSVSAEMHAGFQALRTEMSMECLAFTPKSDLSDACRKDVARMQEIWRDCRQRFGAGGEFLFGHFTAADAMFAPVASRFTTYAPELDDVSRAYVEYIMALPSMQAWIEGARAEEKLKGQG